MEEMTNYKMIQRIESETFGLELLRRGMLPLKLLDYKVYYERYLSELKTKRQGLAITFTAEEFNVSENTIRNAITLMRKC